MSFMDDYPCRPETFSGPRKITDTIFSEIIRRVLNEELLTLESQGHLETAQNRRSEMNYILKS